MISKKELEKCYFEYMSSIPKNKIKEGYIEEADPIAILYSKEFINIENNQIKIIPANLVVPLSEKDFPKEKIQSIQTVAVISEEINNKTKFYLLILFETNPYNEISLPRKNGIITAMPYSL